MWNIPGSKWRNNPALTCLFRCWNIDHMSPKEHTLVGCGIGVQEDPKMRDSKGFVKHQTRSMNTESVIYTRNSWLSSSQALRILMQLAKILKVSSRTKLQYTYVHCHMVVLPATTKSTAHSLPSQKCLCEGLIQFVIALQYIWRFSPTSLICLLRHPQRN